jgi:hypothetical protein
MFSAYATIVQWVEEITASTSAVILLVDWLNNQARIRIDIGTSGLRRGSRHDVREHLKHWRSIGVEHIVSADVENPPRPPKKSDKQPNGEGGPSGSVGKQGAAKKAAWLSKGALSRTPRVGDKLRRQKMDAMLSELHPSAPEIVWEHLRAPELCAVDLVDEAVDSADGFNILVLEAQERLDVLLAQVELKNCKDAAGWMALMIHLALFDGQMGFTDELNPAYKWMKSINPVLKKKHKHCRGWLDDLLNLAAEDSDSLDPE